MTSDLPVCSRCGFTAQHPRPTHDEGVLCSSCYGEWCGEMARCDNQAWESEY